MEILLTAATKAEMAPVLEALRTRWIPGAGGTLTYGSNVITPLLTGVGMVAASYKLGRAFGQKTPDLCINTGIAGAFPHKFDIGDVVSIVEDTIYRLGAETSNGTLLTLKDMGLESSSGAVARYVNAPASEFDFLPKARGITVNTVHGYNESIRSAILACDPDVETMESAAVFHACLSARLPFLVVRGISNLVEERDRDAWDIPLALEKVTQQVLEIINILS